MKSITIFFNTLFDKIYLLFHKNKIVKKNINFFLNQKIAYLVSILLILISLVIVVFSFKRILVANSSIVFNLILMFNILFGIIVVIIFFGLILKEAKPLLFKTYRSKYHTKIMQIEGGLSSVRIEEGIFITSKKDVIINILVKNGLTKNNGELIFPNKILIDKKDVGVFFAKCDEQNLLNEFLYKKNGDLHKKNLQLASKEHLNFDFDSAILSKDFNEIRANSSKLQPEILNIYNQLSFLDNI